MKRKQSVFDTINDWIWATEGSVVNLLSAFAPWLAPLAPAYMTYQHAVNTLKFPIYIATPAALVVEILGFSTVSTYMAFWFYNKRNKAAAKKAPLTLVISAFVFYLALIVSSNVLLDTFPDSRWAVIAVRSLFTLQTVPAAVIVISRVQHRDTIAEYAKVAAATAPADENAAAIAGNFRAATSETPAILGKTRWAQLTTEEISELPTLSDAAIIASYGGSVRRARMWRQWARSQHPGQIGVQRENPA